MKGVDSAAAPPNKNRFEVYQGATGGRSNVSSEFGMAGDVIRLSEGLEGKNNKLYADNFFTSMAFVRKQRMEYYLSGHAVQTVCEERIKS